jgi:hypothetical protein
MDGISSGKRQTDASHLSMVGRAEAFPVAVPYYILRGVSKGKLLPATGTC